MYSCDDVITDASSSPSLGSGALTFDGAVARHFLGHQRPVFVFAVDLHDLLPALPAPGPGQSGDGFLPGDLAARLLFPGLRTGRRRRGRLLRPAERRLTVGPSDRRRDRRRPGVWLTAVGAAVVVVAARPWRLDGRELERLVGGFSQHALRLVRLALAVGRSLALRSSSQVAVAVDGVEVFGDRVLVVVAVRPELLFGPVGAVDVLRGGRTAGSEPGIHR